MIDGERSDVVNYNLYFTMNLVPTNTDGPGIRAVRQICLFVAYVDYF